MNDGLDEAAGSWDAAMGKSGDRVRFGTGADPRITRNLGWQGDDAPEDMGKRGKLGMWDAGRGRPFEGAASEWRMVDGKEWRSCGLRGGAGVRLKGAAKEGMVAVGAGRRRGWDATPPGFRGLGGGWLGRVGRRMRF